MRRVLVRIDRSDAVSAAGVLGGYLVTLASVVIYQMSGQSYPGPVASARFYEWGPGLKAGLLVLAVAGLGYAFSIHHWGWRKLHVFGALCWSAIMLVTLGMLLGHPGEPVAFVAVLGALICFAVAAGRGIVVGVAPAEEPPVD